MRHPVYEYKEVIGDSVGLYNQPAKIFPEVSWDFVADTLYNISRNIMQYKILFPCVGSYGHVLEYMN